MIDPRLAVIHRRVAGIKRILIYSSAKGGVGKSVCAALSALAFSQEGFRTGLLDLDFQGASAHILLKTELDFPEEKAGILPLQVPTSGLPLSFMSFAAFSRENPVPLRGNAVTNAMLELLAITIWGDLDYLLVDMPPGIGDEVLDLLRYLPGAEFLVICTPSIVAVRVVARLVEMLKSLDAKLIGLVENMADGTGDASPVSILSRTHSIPVLGRIPYLARMDSVLAADPLEGQLGRKIKLLISALQAT